MSPRVLAPLKYFSTFWLLSCFEEKQSALFQTQEQKDEGNEWEREEEGCGKALCDEEPNKEKEAPDQPESFCPFQSSAAIRLRV